MSRGLTRTRLKWQNARFYLIYLIVIAAICGIAAYYLRELWYNLADYEAAQTKYVIRDVVDMVQDGDYAAMLEYEGDVPYADQVEDYVEFMEELAAGQEITFRTVYTGDVTGKLVYNLYAGTTRLYEVTLTPTGEVNGHGYELWALSGVKNYNIVCTTYYVQAPQTSQVYADGELLGAEYIVERGIMTGVEEYLLPDILPPTNVVYRMETYFGEPEFRVVDWKGRDQELVTEESGRRVAQTVYDDAEMRELHEEHIMEVAQAFARFTIGDASAHSMLQMIYKDSNAYRYVRGFDTSWFFATFSKSFANGRTENYVLYKDDFFSCDVYFDFTVQYRQETRTYDSAYTLYFRNDGKSWLLYDIVTR